MATTDSPPVAARPLLTPPEHELRKALKQSARLQRRLAVAYGIRLKKIRHK